MLGVQIGRSGEVQSFARFCAAFAQVAGPLVDRAVRYSALDLAIRTVVVVLMVWQPG